MSQLVREPQLCEVANSCLRLPDLEKPRRPSAMY